MTFNLLLTRIQTPIQIIALFICFFSAVSHAEMQIINDDKLGNINAKNGISLSGTLDLNSSGGPLWDYNRDANGDAVNCTDNNGKCGARFALNGSGVSGWFILDNIKGGFSFGESDSDPSATGLEISVQHNTTASDNGTEKDVVQFKLPTKVNYDNVSMTLATGSHEQDNTLQTNILTVEINGPVIMQGKLLVFP